MKPHILILSRITHFHSTGGMQAIAWDLARTFAEQGNEVTFLTTSIPGQPSAFALDGVNVRALEGTVPGRYSCAWWRGSRKFAESSLASTTAVLSVSAAAYALLPLRARFPAVKMIMQAHGTSLGECLSKWRSSSIRAWAASVRNLVWLFRDLCAYPKFTHVVAIGNAVYEALTGRPISLLLPNYKVVLIANGIDTALFKPDPGRSAIVRANLGWDETEEIVVSVSRLHRQKGVHLSIKTFAELLRSRPNARYLVVGDGPERPSLQKQALDLKIEDKVMFMGDLDRDRLLDCLKAADAFLFTTIRTEGLPLNVLEALAVGLPIVTTTLMAGAFETCASVAYHFPEDTGAAAKQLEAALTYGMQTRRRRVSLLAEQYSLASCAAGYQKLFLGERTDSQYA